MPFWTKLEGEYHKDNPFKEGDIIKWKCTGEIMTVGNDWDELKYWTGGDDRFHIVTTNGRVLSIEEIEKV